MGQKSYKNSEFIASEAYLHMTCSGVPGVPMGAVVVPGPWSLVLDMGTNVFG